MESRATTFWLLWSAMALLLAALVAALFVIGPSATPYTDAGVSVLAFVLSLFAMTAAVGSLASRESLVRAIAAGAIDPRTPRDRSRTLRTLLGTWTLCVVVGALGSMLGWAAAKTQFALPYWVAAATLLAFHAPRAAILDRHPAGSLH
jgi:hypothetical protein